MQVRSFTNDGGGGEGGGSDQAALGGPKVSLDYVVGELFVRHFHLNARVILFANSDRFRVSASTQVSIGDRSYSFALTASCCGSLKLFDGRFYAHAVVQQVSGATSRRNLNSVEDDPARNPSFAALDAGVDHS